VRVVGLDAQILAHHRRVAREGRSVFALAQRASPMRPSIWPNTLGVPATISPFSR
jgi:hypothetical protein